MVRARFLTAVGLAVVLSAACGGSDASISHGDPAAGNGGPGGGPNGSDGGAPGSGGGGGGGGAAGSAAQLAIKLRGKAEFMIGMGNDLADNHDNDGAYTLGKTLDLHYAYLVGLKGQNGWTDWNPNGSFVNILSDSAEKHGTTPMYTLYGMAAWGESNLNVLTNDAYMRPYLEGAKLLFERIAIFGKPAVVHVEPDFWAFVQGASPDAKAPVHIAAHAPDCAGVSEDVAGLGRCLIKLARTHAPKAVLGFHASSWAGTLPETIAFMKAIGADQADFVATDMLDRDAGCFEAHVDPACQRGGKTGWYWDETNTKKPNFHDHLAWAKGLHDGVGLPLIWWQVPFGVPSETPGGTPGNYRDNRVRYLFSHVPEFVAAGGAGAVFGVGAANQTYITTDGGQFKDAVAGYYAAPAKL